MPQNNRLFIALGAVAALALAVVLALFLSRGDTPSGPPPAAKGGLTVDIADAPGLDTQRQLRCYVDGRYAGLATLTDCARRNGLATDALDVGVDASGGLAAAPTASLSPPPPTPIQVEASAPAPSAEAPVEVAVAPQPTGQACVRHIGGAEWRTVSPGTDLNACVQALYAGVCVRPGDAQYGRWGETMLRLVPRRVEQSFDNQRFRTLANQDRSCQFPGL